MKRRNLRPRGTNSLSKVTEEDVSREQGPVPAVSTPRPGPQPQAHLSAQLSLCVCLLGRAQALGERLGYSVSKVVFILKCGPLQALRCRNASWGLCCLSVCINPGTNTKAGLRKQEAPHLELIATSVYPVSLGEIWHIHVGKSG